MKLDAGVALDGGVGGVEASSRAWTGVGWSTARSSERAAREAIEQAVTELGGPVHHVIAFYTARHDAVAVARTLRAVCGAETTGCSAGGVITRGRADEGEHVLGVMAIGGGLRATGFLVPDYGERSAEAGTVLATAVQRQLTDDALALVVLPDGLAGDCSAFLARLQEGLPDGFPIVGGASADAQRMERTSQLHGDSVISGGVAALLLTGRGSVAHGVSHGCSPIGSRKRITRAHDGWVEEIDHRPAWDEVRAYLDGHPTELNADGIMHVSVGRELTPGGAVAEYTIRTPMLLRKEDGALFFPGGDLSTGDAIRMVMRSPSAIAASAAALGDRLGDRADRPKAVLHFDCAGRGKLLFGSTTYAHTVEPLQSRIGDQVPWLGMHSYGEVAPLGGKARYHNYTATVLAVYAP